MTGRLPERPKVKKGRQLKSKSIMKIVILDGYTLNPGDLSWDWLTPFGEVVIYDRTAPGEIAARLADANVIFTNKTPLDGSVLGRLRSLKYIGVTATGYNIVDTAAAKAKGVVVANAPAYGTVSVVQMTFALLLELCLHVQKHSDSVYQGKWARSPDFCYTNFPLVGFEGKTMGIIGYGDIGRKVGEVAAAFGMKVLAAGRRSKEAVAEEAGQGEAVAEEEAARREIIRWEDPVQREDFKRTGLEELLAGSDFVSIHCPLTPQTKGMIDKDRLALMKASAFLINTSRGPIIVEEDLAEALNNNIIAGAGVDVLSLEPPREGNPLFHAKNCIITPHIAWATKEARSRLMEITRENFSAFIKGSPVNVVNP
jgi:glycerate dehydrogenase